MKSEFGLNFFGSWETSDGIGRAAALNIECLESSGIPFETYILSRPVALQSGRDTIINDELLARLRYRINLFQFSARWVPHYFSNIKASSLGEFYNIGYWFCEVPKIPADWARQAKFFDEIWTASSFCQTSISRSVNKPVVSIPLLIEEREVGLRIGQDKIINKPFTYLTIFNAYSDAERKNSLFTIRAFLEAFSENMNVRLVIKASNLEHDSRLMAKFSEISAKYKNVIIKTGYVENAVIQQLYDDANVYVSLHRAEGFGLTISDAMSRGIPVITTGYSGNMEFCQQYDTRLVGFKLCKVSHERLRYQSDDVWAEPDMEDAIVAFKELFFDYESWLKRARYARDRVRDNYSKNVIGELMKERLELINTDFSHDIKDRGERKVDVDVGIMNTYGF